jgi:hypothetical protein
MALAAKVNHCQKALSRKAEIMEDLQVHDSDVNQFSVDERIATYLGRQGQKLSRRGLLAGAGRLILRLSGLALLPLLPLDRRANAYTDPCGWQQCGMCGSLCKACCGNTKPTSGPSCPSCLTTYGSWSGCCTDPSCGAKHVVTYTDCGSVNSSTALSCRSSSQCGSGCAALGETLSNASFYGDPSATYGCTVISVSSASC